MAVLNLDDLRPEPHVLKFRNVEYRLPGQVPVPTVLRVVELERQMTDAAEREEAAKTGLLTAVDEHGAESPEAEKAMEAFAEVANDPAWENAVSETYNTVMELLRDENDDVPDLRLSAQECQAILATIKTGAAPSAESVRAGRALAESVAEEVGLVGVGVTAGDASEGETVPPTAPHAAPKKGKTTRTTGGGGSSRPKPSRKPSSG